MGKILNLNSELNTLRIILFITGFPLLISIFFLSLSKIDLAYTSIIFMTLVFAVIALVKYFFLLRERR